MYHLSVCVQYPIKVLILLKLCHVTTKSFNAVPLKLCLLCFHKAFCASVTDRLLQPVAHPACLCVYKSPECCTHVGFFRHCGFLLRLWTLTLERDLSLFDAHPAPGQAHL